MDIRKNFVIVMGKYCKFLEKNLKNLDLTVDPAENAVKFGPSWPYGMQYNTCFNMAMTQVAERRYNVKTECPYTFSKKALERSPFAVRDIFCFNNRNGKLEGYNSYVTIFGFSNVKKYLTNMRKVRDLLKLSLDISKKSKDVYDETT